MYTETIMKFIAKDGTVFTKRCEYKRYEMETQYTFRNRESTTLMKPIGSISGQPFVISSCKNSTILLLDHCDQVQIDDTSFSKIFIAACSESVFLRDCSNCSLTVACKQFRTRNCKDCDIYLYCTTEPVIENSTGMRFAPFNGAFEGHLDVMKKARLLSDGEKDSDDDDQDIILPKKQNQWYKVYDFTPSSPTLDCSYCSNDGFDTTVLLQDENKKQQQHHHQQHVPSSNWEIMQKKEQDEIWFISNPLEATTTTSCTGSNITDDIIQPRRMSYIINKKANKDDHTSTNDKAAKITTNNKTGTPSRWWKFGSRMMKFKTQIAVAPRTTIDWIFSTFLTIFQKIVMTWTGKQSLFAVMDKENTKKESLHHESNQPVRC